MEKFTTLTAIAAPLPIINIDTDMIIPKQFLKTIKRSGLGVHLFDEMRYDDNGSELADFILNQEPYRNAKILVAGDNFGCGSSREHAPWALNDFGIKAIISTSFADIFFNNSFKNGMLPIVQPKEVVAELMEVAEKGKEITVDLANQKILADGKEYGFEVDPFRKHCLIEGLDDIGLTLQKSDAIKAYEQKHYEKEPWISLPDFTG
ncbi:MAG: 3-isopropylmalate dehydratase small subunit [Alphaproteobacteria bacterium]